MKVNDLFENDWENNPEETLRYLYKKQFGECEALLRNIQKQIKSAMAAGKSKSYISALQCALDYFGWSNPENMRWKDGLDTLGVFRGVSTKKIYDEWSRILDLKQRYENLGGSYNLTETKDWDNQPQTLQSLRKKMLASCHRFVLQATKVGFYDPNKNFYFNLLSSQSSTSGVIRGLLGAILSYANQNLKLRFDEMKIAKQEYERAGGKYEG